jgi:hypothetical protein
MFLPPKIRSGKACKVPSVNPLNAKKITETVLLYLFRIAFTAFLSIVYIEKD